MNRRILPIPTGDALRPHRTADGKYAAYAAPPTKIERLSPNIVVGIAQHRAGFFDPKERQHADVFSAGDRRRFAVAQGSVAGRLHRGLSRVGRRVYVTANEFKHCTAACAVAEILRLQGKRAEAVAELNRIEEAKMTLDFYREMLRKSKAAAANER